MHGRRTRGLEVHLALIHKAITEFEPSVVVVDPITNFLGVGDVDRNEVDAHAPD
jgi:hypothetical protein